MTKSSEQSSNVKRRTVLQTSPVLITAAKYGSIGGAAAVAAPFLASLSSEKDSSSAAEAAPLRINLKELEDHPTLTAQWGRYPLLIQKRSAETLKTLQDKAHTSRLLDPLSERHQQPEYARNWHRSSVPEIGVYVNICTHLGCLSRPSTWEHENVILCPCHGTQFDAAARVFKNMPARFNLPVPPHKIEKTKNGTFLVVGEDGTDKPFDLNTVERL